MSSLVGDIDINLTICPLPLRRQGIWEFDTVITLCVIDEYFQVE